MAFGAVLTDYAKNFFTVNKFSTIGLLTAKRYFPAQFAEANLLHLLAFLEKRAPEFRGA